MKHGFTLIEILVVVSLLSIAAVMVVPNLRKFNEDQELESSANSLKEALRIAQSSSISGIKCSSLPSSNWRVSLLQNQFNISALCKDPTTLDLPSPEPRSTTSFPSGVAISADNCQPSTGSVNADVIFTKGIPEFFCTGTPQGLAAGPFIITLTSSKTGQNRQVTVNNGGIIY